MMTVAAREDGPPASGPRGKEMRTVVVAAAFAGTFAASTLAGCANVTSPQMSHLGFAQSDAAEPTAEPSSADTPDAIRHVDSNRVLGAMAFQKVTRAKVDPQALVKSRR